MEARLNALDAMLASPKVFRSKDLSKEIKDERKTLKSRLAKLYESWEELAGG